MGRVRRRDVRNCSKGSGSSGIAVAAFVGAAGWLLIGTPVHSQAADTGSHTIFHRLTRDELAEELHRSVTATGIAPQQYMREVFRGFGDDTPAFVRDALMQVVGRTYHLKRENFDGTTSQAWAGGGWLAYRRA